MSSMTQGHGFGFTGFFSDCLITVIFMMMDLSIKKWNYLVGAMSSMTHGHGFGLTGFFSDCLMTVIFMTKLLDGI
jgi:hypothetical protein